MTQQFHSWVYIQKKNTEKDTCTAMFKAVLFTIAKIWKQFKCPSTEGQIKKMWCVSTHRHTHTQRHRHTYRHTQTHTDTHTHTAIEKKKIFVICNNMDEQGGYMLSEISQIEKKSIMCYYLYVEYKNTTNYRIQQKKKIRRYREQTSVPVGWGNGGEKKTGEGD